MHDYFVGRYRQPDPASETVEAEFEAAPATWQSWVDDERVGFDLDTREAAQDGLPDAGEVGYVQPGRRYTGRVAEVEVESKLQHFQRIVGSSHPGEQRRRDRGRQRGAVRGTRSVEIQVGGERVRCHLVGYEVVQHQHVGLLDDL
jgi:hypothetical protein